ncbi:MAG: transglutaminase N-terminal domain-containing protein [Candidatus Tectimicrobiota bacterium]
MIYLVQHTTTYTYPGTVSICYNEVHLRPRDSAWQTCTDYDLVVHPAPGVMNLYDDFFGNHVAFFTVQEPHRTLTVMAHSTVRITPASLPDPETTPAWDSVPDSLRHDRSPEGLQAYQQTLASPYVPLSARLRHYAMPSFPPGRPLLAAVLELTQRIYRDFTYDPKATSISTPLHTVLRLRRGVCQDFAHLQIGCLRALGLAARYISGYLVTQPPPGRPRLVGADASHAWVAVYCPGYGWIDADPTNNLLPSERHVTVAIGRDYSDVSPIKGVFLGGGQHIMRVAVDVIPVAG